MFKFVLNLYKSIKVDNLISISNELTYKLLLSLFPFIIFLMSVFSFLNINPQVFIKNINQELPNDIAHILSSFIDEIVSARSLNVLYSSLVISIINSSSGFGAIIQGINKAYGIKDSRNFIKKRIISIFLVLIFSITIIFSALLMVFGDTIRDTLLSTHLFNKIPTYFFGFAAYLTMLAILLIITIVIYKLSIDKKIKIINILPGACITVALWVISSKIFNIYVNNISKFSVLYGSIAGIFILMFWLNLISFFLLLGCEINELIEIKNY